MECLKCGKAVTSNPPFCDECAAIMEQHPVKPGTVIHIPHREAPGKRHIQREPSAQEQLSGARRLIRWLYLVIALLSLLLSITGIMLIRALDNTPANRTPSKGQNYTTSQQP